MEGQPRAAVHTFIIPNRGSPHLASFPSCTRNATENTVQLARGKHLSHLSYTTPLIGGSQWMVRDVWVCPTTIGGMGIGVGFRL